MTLSARLKSSTSQHHRELEAHPLQRSLFVGEITFETYRAYLEELLHIHHVLAETVLRAGADCPALAELWQGTADYVTALETDLHHCSPGALPAPPPSAQATTLSFLQVLQTWATDKPAALLGVVYVFEGSTNGGKFLARAIERLFDWERGQGTNYLDPHGDAVRDHWHSWRRKVDAAELSPEQQDEVVDGAISTFENLHAIITEVWDRKGSSTSAAPV